jgi:hypothetical protein
MKIHNINSNSLTKETGPLQFGGWLESIARPEDAARLPAIALSTPHVQGLIKLDSGWRLATKSHLTSPRRGH